MSRELLEEIRRRIAVLHKRKQEEIGVAGREEQQIAILYFKLGDLEACGDWWIRSAQEAEQYGQIFIAHQRLVIAARDLPLHLNLRRELLRLAAVIDCSSG